MGRIADARSRWQAIQVDPARLSSPLTRDQLAAALSTAVESCQVWQANWRNRIYRVTLGDGTVAVAKQACIQQNRELACEFAALQRLAALQIPRLRVPRPIAYLSALQTYLMEMAPGEPLDGLLRQGRRREFVRACGLAGEVLAQIHNGWCSGHQPLEVDALASELLSIPLKLTRGQRDTIQAVLHVLSKRTLPIGQPYLDFKAANVLFDGCSLALIDPPEEQFDAEPLIWDVGVFTVSIEHILWKCIGRRAWRGARKAVSMGISRFQRTYRRHLAGLRIPSQEFRLLTQIVRLQRVGQLIALQNSKLQSGCRRRIPFTSRDSRLLGVLTESIPLPLLAAHSHYLLLQMSQIGRTTESEVVRGC